MPELTSLTTYMSETPSPSCIPVSLTFSVGGGCILSPLDMPKLATVTLSPSAFKHRTSIVKEGVCSLVPSRCRHWRAGEVL